MHRAGGGPWHLGALALAWLLGTAVQLQTSHPLPGVAVAAGALLATALLLLAFGRAAGGPRPLARTSVLAPLVAVAAFATADLRSQSRLQDALAPSLEGQDLLLAGVVAGLPRRGPAGTLFEFEVESAAAGGQAVRVPARVSLTWGAGWDGEVLLESPGDRLVAGDRWQLPVRLRRPHGLRNPHGFDLELWMFERGLGASGSVRPGARFLGTTASRPIARWRQQLRDDLLRRVDDPRAAGVLAALAVGDQAAIDADDWEVFRVTGVAHLMSISGLHVTLFAWLAAAAVGRAWRAVPAAMRAWPAPDAARWCGLALALAYALLAGWGVPAQRTVLMLATVTVLRATGWRWPWPLVWLASGSAVTLLDPWALLQPGFWLSFVAVGLLMASDPARPAAPPAGLPRWRRALASGLRTQAVATVGLAPLTLVFFQQVSLVGALANLLAVPWVTLVVTPLALAGVVLPGAWALGAMAVRALAAVLEAMAAVPAAQWTAAAAPAWAALAGLLGGALLVLPLPWRLRLLGLPLMLPLLAPQPPRPPEGEAEIVAADVGQGTAVLVRTRHRLMVYDTGPRYSLQSDAGARVLLPLLRARGETVIDQLVLSHRDSDHTGGAASLLRGIEVHRSLGSLEPEHPLRQRLPRYAGCEAGQHWTWDGVHFEVLHPLPGAPSPGVAPNALSCVVRVSDRHGPLLLLTGDIEAAQEAALVARRPAGTLATPILVLPHHGSRTSSSPELLRAVQPQVAIAQVGYRSRFGHPAQPVRERLAVHGITLVRSDDCGAWQWGGGRRVAGAAPAAVGSPREAGRCERHLDRRYWHHPGVR